MTRRDSSLLSMILIPSIISNLVTLLRFGLELRGFGIGFTPREMTWWISLWTMMILSAIYFAFMLRDAARPYRRLLLTLYVYALSVRVLTALLYYISGAMHLNTHYSIYGPPGSNVGYVLGGLFPQLVIWPIVTVIVGSIVGMPVLALLRARRNMKPALP